MRRGKINFRVELAGPVFNYVPAPAVQRRVRSSFGRGTGYPSPSGPEPPARLHILSRKGRGNLERDRTTFTSHLVERVSRPHETKSPPRARLGGVAYQHVTPTSCNFRSIIRLFRHSAQGPGR
jgi:hypothetical protein